MIQLIREGIESNPRPTIEFIKVITINCNRLMSDQRLLQAIGRLKKKIKTCNFSRLSNEVAFTEILAFGYIEKAYLKIAKD